MRLRTRLLISGLVILLFTTAGAVATILLSRQALEARAFAQLRSVRETKASQIEEEIAQFLRNLDVLAGSTAARTGLRDLPPAFAELGEPIDEETLTGYYVTEFAPRVAGEDLGPRAAAGLAPRSDSGRKLQDLYISTNPWPVGHKDNLDDADDGSRYSQIHADLHPFFREALNGFGAYDIFLVDPDGTIVYTVFKEIDVATNLTSGSLQSSGLAEVWRTSVSTDDLAVTDFAPYLPSYNAPASFAARGVYDANGVRLGTIAMQLPVDRINGVMTSNGRWSETGLGASGETYLVADDLTMRNDSRFLIEAPDDYFAAISAVESTATVASIQALDSTIGLQTVDTLGTRDALSGMVGEQIFEDYRGVPVLSSYRPLDLGESDLTWVVMSEIDRGEAFADVAALSRTAAAALLGVTAALAAVIVIGSRRLTRPLQLLEDETAVVEAFDFTGTDDYDTTRLGQVAARKDEIGDLAGAFSRMTAALGENVRSRVEVEGELNVAAEIQQSMLPLTFPAFPEHVEFQIHARLTPAKEIGGDFFEHGFIDSEHFFFTVGDVSGKGIPAALFMAAIKTLIRSGAIQGEEPAELLTRINSELSRDNPEMMFATVWLGVLDIRTGAVVYTNAGHNPPALVTTAGAAWVPDVHGPMVGPIPGVTYIQDSIQLDAGSMLVVFSDGVTEAMSPTDEPYGEPRLAHLLTSAEATSSAQVTASVVEDVLRWEAGSVRSDDVTVMALRYLGPHHTADIDITLRLDPDEPMSAERADELSAANESLADDARQAGLGEVAVQRLQIAMDEVLTNIASYSGASEIVVRAWLDAGALSVEVSDDGTPYDPLDAPEPDTDLPLKDRVAGGLGIHLVRSLTSDVSYEHVGGRNMLTFTVTTQKEP